jgi:hypothetical protein
MFHPLINDLRSIKDQDLESKIVELTKKYQIASRMGQGMAAHQIALVIEVFKEEFYRRQERSMEKLANKDKDLDDLINVE